MLNPRSLVYKGSCLTTTPRRLSVDLIEFSRQVDDFHSVRPLWCNFAVINSSVKVGNSQKFQST